jgi:hypothetical protein
MEMFGQALFFKWVHQTPFTKYLISCGLLLWEEKGARGKGRRGLGGQEG